MNKYQAFPVLKERLCLWSDYIIIEMELSIQN